ncbi:MAG: MotA/TolQ/ExbB proton channel family protein [Pseudomonadota bacterium]
MEEKTKTLGPGAKVGLVVGFIVLWLLICFALWALSASEDPSKVGAFKQGGWGMWPILAVGMIFVVVSVERFRYLFFGAKTKTKEFVAEIQKHLMGGNVEAAVARCRSAKQPLARIVGAGLSNIHLPDRDVQDAVDETALYELPKIEKRTGYLAMIGNIATLLGLLGTIVGLITSFAGVSLEGENNPKTIERAANYKHLVPKCRELSGKALVSCISANKSTVLAKGISEAMNCTAFGLLVGILSLLAFSFLNGRTQRLLDEISDTTVHLMNLAVLHRNAMKIDAPAKDGQG